jgi:hypothetical protein
MHRFHAGIVCLSVSSQCFQFVVKKVPKNSAVDFVCSMSVHYGTFYT